MRQVVLDTETTGLEPKLGHRVIELGCVELHARRHTQRHFHQYLNPQRQIDAGALAVHGISNEFLNDKPLFANVVEQFIEFIAGAELVIHNAAFDVAFLDHELNLLGPTYGKVEDHCTVLDTLSLARERHPGQRNSLDALCKRYDVDNSQRELHGALLDARILADVYLAMTGGQTSLELPDAVNTGSAARIAAARTASGPAAVRVLRAAAAELEAHEAMLDIVDKSCADGSVWRREAGAPH